MNEPSLRYTIPLLGLIPIITAIVGLMGVNGPLYKSSDVPENVLLDSNLRFFKGLWLGLGLTLLWLVPRIDTQTAVYRILWGMFFWRR